MNCESFSWSVELPDATTNPYAAFRNKARVHLESGGTRETWDIPKPVGRRLEKLRKTSGIDPMTRSELAQKVKEVSLLSGTSKVEWLVNKRDYSSKELLEKLLQDGYSQEVSEELVSRAENNGLVNDDRFAEVYIHSKSFAGWGRRKIERELARKGIDCNQLPGWPEHYISESDEAERALELARRRRLTGKNDFQKIVRHLLSKGYSMSIAYDAAKTALDSASDGGWSV